MKQIIPIIALILSLIMTSYQTDLELNDVIDQKSSFTLTIKSVDSKMELSPNETEKIEVNSEKWIKPVDFVKDNMNGWQSSPAYYIGDIYVSKGDFRLLQTNGSNGVVIVLRTKKATRNNTQKELTKENLTF